MLGDEHVPEPPAGCLNEVDSRLTTGRLQDQQPVVSEQLGAPGHRPHGVGQMLQYVEGDDEIARARAQLLVFDWTQEHASTRRASRVVDDPGTELDSGRIEAGGGQ